MATMLRTLRARYDHGHRIGDHHHAWGQLVYAAGGAVHVTASTKTWLIPSARAVWLPPGATHQLRMRGTTRLRTIYVPHARCAGLADAALGLAVTPLLRELILELARLGHVDEDDPHQAALGNAFLWTLRDAKPCPLALTMPMDRRALRLAEHLQSDPASHVPLVQLARQCGASLRTLQRIFLGETGMALSEWRQMARLMVAATCLLDGQSVTSAALSAGYAGTSAFVYAFRKTVGETPSAFGNAHASPG